MFPVLIGLPVAGWAGRAHEHGVVRAEVGVETGRITLSLELPLDDLVGFERAPRTDAERSAVAAALGKLQDGARQVRVDSAAGCGPAKVELVAPPWGLGVAGVAAAASGTRATAAKAGAAEHGDLEARYELRCSSTDKATYLELDLFDSFARIKRIEVQAVTPRGQMKLVLRRPGKRISLAR